MGRLAARSADRLAAAGELGDRGQLQPGGAVRHPPRRRHRAQHLVIRQPGQVPGGLFGQRGQQLAATSYDGSVHLWDTSAATASSSICANLGQALTPAQWSSYVPGVAYQPACPG